MADSVDAKEKQEKDKILRAILNKYAKKNPDAKVGIGDTNFGKIEVVKSGVLTLDRLTQGFPRGLYTHISGPSQVGKSTLALRLIAELQKKGLRCGLANNERRFSREWAIANGVDMNEIVGGNFPDLEACLDLMIDIAQPGADVDCIVVDTITALSSRGELRDKKGDRSTDDNTMAQIARKLSQFFRMATARINDSRMVVILINQIRKDLSNTVYVKDISTGGNALEHNKSLDIFLRRAAKKEWPTNGGTADKPLHIGHTIKATLLKCTHTMQAQEGDEVMFNFIKGQGFSSDYDAVYHARLDGLITETSRGRKWAYTPVKGDPVEIAAGRYTVDFRMMEELKDLGRIGELRERLEKQSLNNLGDITSIELDKEAESEEAELV